MKITVIGCGRLGAPYAAGMAALGHEVLGVDTNPETAALLMAGKPPFGEPGLEEAITAGADNGRLRFTQDITAAAAHARVHFIAVPTPQSGDSDHHDLTAVYDAAEQLARVITRDSLIVVKSSVPAGTCEEVARRVAAIVPLGIHVEIAASPDFMREGLSIADVMHPTRIVLGVQPDGAAPEILGSLWRMPIADGVPFVVTDLRTAELAKLAANAFLATRVSYVNALAGFASAVGANIGDLAAAMGHDPRIGSDYLAPGLGFGGSCLTKDLRGLVAMADAAGVDLGLLRAVDDINQGRRAAAVEAARDAVGGNLVGAHIGVWGAAFKSNIDDVRDSPALDVAVRLHRAGAHVKVYDPRAMDNACREHPELTYVMDPAAAADGVQVLLHLTGWQEFAGVDPGSLFPAPNPTLVDGRRGLRRQSWTDHGWNVVAL